MISDFWIQFEIWNLIICLLGEPNNAGGTDFSFGEDCSVFNSATSGCMNDIGCGNSNYYYICKMGNLMLELYK